MTAIYVFSGLLIAISGGLIAWHVAAWKTARRDDLLSELDRDFAWRQCRRRAQTSGMIGLIGVGLAGIRLVLMTGNGVVVTVYVLVLVAITVWVILLAVADMMETRMHCLRIHRRESKEEQYDESNS